MNKISYTTAALLVLGLSNSAMAQAPAATDAAAAERAAAARAKASSAKASSANTVVVIEDEGARIEETRKRGEVVRVQVQSKLGGAASYEITLRPGRDPSTQTPGSTGRSAWQVLSF